MPLSKLWMCSGLSFVAGELQGLVAACLPELADIAVLPGTAEWDADDGAVHRVRFPNAERGSTPAFVAVPQTAEDVQRCIRCANRVGVTVAVKGGGHAAHGFSSIGQEGFMINMAEINAITEPTTDCSGTACVTTVYIGAGARWEDVYVGIDAHGGNWDITGGECLSVGVVGYTLGGGASPTSRLYGLAADNARSFDMVTVTGDFVTANETHHRDLYWALRGGGGGNFGVITGIKFQVHPGRERYSWGALCYNNSEANVHAVLGAVNEHYSKMSPAIYMNIGLHQKSGLCLKFFNMMGLTETRVALAPLLAAVGLKPTSDDLTHEHATLSDMMLARAGSVGETDPFTNEYFVQTNCMIKDMTKEFMASLARLYDSAPAVCKGVTFVSFGGRIRDVAADATAFPWRDFEYAVRADCDIWFDTDDYADQIPKAKQYLKEWNAAMSPHCGGGKWASFMSPDLSNQPELYQKQYYGQNLERLQAVKDDWVPAENHVLEFPMQIQVSRSIVV